MEEDKNLTNKDKFYINKLTQDLPLIIDTIKEQQKLSKFNKSIFEKEIIIDKGNNTFFKGYIDKIIYNDDKDTRIALIDYKTGSADADLSYFSYGINMQLPVYLYLATKLNFKDIKFAGFYLQKLLLPTYKKDRKLSLDEQKKENLKLDGYSISNEDLLGMLDITYKDSSLIRSLKVTKDNTFYAYSKVLTEKQIDKLIKLTENKIEKTINGIRNGNYEINPKRTNKELLGCKYCQFKDICYKTRKDEVYMNAIDIKQLLGGESDQ